MAEGRLSARRVATITEPGYHADGGGLYLRVPTSGTRGWIYRYQIQGRRRDMGLGRLDDVSLAEARARAAEARGHVAEGRDPIDLRATARAAVASPPSLPTVSDAAEALLEARRPRWSSPKSAQAWESTLAAYVLPAIGDRPVAEVSTDDVLDILRPLWTTRTETASRVRGRIEAVLDYARVRGWREGSNPAAWRGHLDHLLPRPGDVAPVEHHRALPWQAMPAWWPRLRAEDGLGARALELLILTASRSGEVLGARWPEIDVSGRAWTIPAGRMKARREHRVPLSPPAVDLVRRLEARRLTRATDTDLVFPGQRRGRPLSDMTLTAMLRRMEADAVPHGFRSTFRTWAAEVAGAPHEVCEAALAHTPRDKVVAAYQRGDLLDRRRALMDAWAAWLESGAGQAAGS